MDGRDLPEVYYGNNQPGLIVVPDKVREWCAYANEKRRLTQHRLDWNFGKTQYER